jgi:hypothetical protein
MGREAEDGERGHQAVEIAPEAGEDDTVGEPALPDERLDVGPQRSLAADHEPGLGSAPPDEGHRLDERRVVLVVGEGGHVADDRRAARHAELRESVRATRRRGAVDDPLVDEVELLNWDASRLDDAGDRAAHDDDAVAGRVLAAREGRGEREVDAAHRHEGAAPGEAGGHERGRDGVRVVQHEGARRHAAEEAREREDRGRPEVPSERDRVHRDARGAGPRLERAAEAAGEGGRHASRNHARRREEDLVLSASPPGGRVDVEHGPAHRQGVEGRPSSRSFASFAKV